ncbi:MAG: hypothetical protein MUE45_05185 [Methanoregulaceae archaeon]|jgi:hypothetical protein|nr:hypothetical protein [Methanoregulaceae archaeon]
MKPAFLVIIIFFLSAGFVIPGSATYSLQDVTVTPSADTYPSGISLNSSAVLPIIPAGPTTFIEGYTMVLSTDLNQAGWNIRVMVDGHQAAVFQKFGNTVFINGYLLSYPVARDVEVRVALEGSVPPSGAENTFSVLRVVELNNQGQVVSGSEQTVNGAITIPATLPSLPLQSESVAELSTTAANAGVSLAPVMGSIFLIFFFIRRREG